MDELGTLQQNRHWRMAVWALRVGYLGLATAIVGLFVVLSGATPWVLFAGVILWLTVVIVTLIGFVRARLDIPEPRPRLWSMRMRLIHDSVHARLAS
jgi:O-antigen/teichoic acid export membrane protein